MSLGGLRLAFVGATMSVKGRAPWNPGRRGSAPSPRIPTPCGFGHDGAVAHCVGFLGRFLDDLGAGLEPFAEMSGVLRPEADG